MMKLAWVYLNLGSSKLFKMGLCLSQWHKEPSNSSFWSIFLGVLYNKKKRSHVLSAIGIDQADEENTNVVKTEGRAIRISDNERTLLE